MAWIVLQLLTELHNVIVGYPQERVTASCVVALAVVAISELATASKTVTLDGASLDLQTG